jgi:hypothetical protein
MNHPVADQQTAAEFRELDAAMHRICGWTYDPSRRAWHRRGFWTAEPNTYSTEDGPTFEVLEKCGDALPGGIKIKRKPDGKWMLSKFEDLEPMWSVAETLQLAICRFAKAVFEK